MKAVYINTDNETYLASLDPNDMLSGLQQAVEGFIEAVSLTDNITMWINEEGKLNDLPVNVIATLFYHAAHGPHDIIMGNVILTGGPDEDGNTTELDMTELAKFSEIANQYTESL